MTCWLAATKKQLFISVSLVVKTSITKTNNDQFFNHEERLKNYLNKSILKTQCNILFMVELKKVA